MKSIELCIVGAGSSYTPELIEGIVARAELPVTALRLSDTHAERLGIMAGLAERMIRARGRAIRVHHDTRLEPMIDGADFVVTQIRVGGMDARRLDESIPRRFGIIGQETTGPGGMFKALRTIPAMLDIARTVAQRAPTATILNYTNPSGLITEAVLRHTGARLIGLCSGIPSVQQRVHERLDAHYPLLRTYSVGLNHLGFIHRLTSEGRDVTDEAIARFCVEERTQNPSPDAIWLELVETLGAIPMWGYTSLFYNRSRRVAEQANDPRTRADAVAELEKQIFAEAADPTISTKPPALAKRGGGGYSDITFAVLEAMLHDTGAELVCSAMNGSAVEGIPADASVEITCRIGRDGATPVPVGPLPLAFRGIVQAVKAYETLTVQAAVTRDRATALRALLSHPLCGDIEVARPLLDAMIEAHRLELH